MKKIFFSGQLFVIFAALLWSFDGVLRISLYSLPPAVIVFYEHVLGAIFLLLIAFKWVGDLSKMSFKEYLAIAAVALFSGLLGTLFYTAALQQIKYTSYSVVVLLQQQLQPIWAISAAVILLKEKITRGFLVWAALALVAAYFITFPNLTVNLSTGSGTALAGLLALLAGLGWGTSTAISKYVLRKVSFLTGTALRFILAPIFALFYIIPTGETQFLFKLNITQWGTLLLITFSTGMVALLLYYYGLKKIPARITTICELVWPASAIFIDFFLYNKSLSLTQWIGVVFLLLAIYKVTASRPVTYSAMT